MIEIVKENKTNKKREPYYTLTYEYMIGDANGDTSKTVKLSLDNPFIERYVTLLNSLTPTNGTWGVMLSEEDLTKHFNEGQITEDDYKFLCRTMLEEMYGDELEFPFIVSEENEKYANEFVEGVCSDTEYSFLVFEGCNLKYVDEFGVKHKTIIK